MKKTKNIRLRAHLFDSDVVPALAHVSETWTLRRQDEHAVSVIQRAVERTMLGVTRYTQEGNPEFRAEGNPEFRPTPTIVDQGRCRFRQGIEDQVGRTRHAIW